MNYYAFNIGDYAAATHHLTDAEDLAYRRLLDLYYVTEKPIPVERRQVYRLVRASSEESRQAIDTVLPEFFSESPDGWRHKRCDEEIAAVQLKSEKARESANSKWEKARALRPQCDRNATASETTCERIVLQSEGNAPNPNPNPNPISSEPPDEFEAFDAALRATPGISKHPVFAAPVIAPIWQLAQQGYNLKTQIIPSIERQARRQKPIRSWSFFVDGIVEDCASKPLPAVDAGTWEIRLKTARSRSQWDATWGPPPHETGCRVPHELLSPDDGRGWSLWKPAA